MKIDRVSIVSNIEWVRISHDDLWYVYSLFGLAPANGHITQISVRPPFCWRLEELSGPSGF